MKDPEWKVRKNAAESLGGFAAEAEKSVPVLMGHLEDNEVEVRRQAILSLGRLGKGNAKVEEALKKHSQDADTLSRLNAIVGLTALGKTDDSVIPTLTEAMLSKEKSTSKQAGRALAKIAERVPDKVLPQMMDALGNSDESVRSNTLQVLRYMKDKAIPALPKMAALYDKASPRTRMDIIETAVAVDVKGDQAISLVDKGLKASDPLDRKDALLALMKYRNRSDLFLTELKVALKDPDPENRFLALRIVSGQGDRSAKLMPELLPLTKDPELRVRRQALKTVSAFPDPSPEVMAALGESLKDKDFRIRMATVGILGDMARSHPDKATALLEDALKTEKHEATKRMISSTLARIGQKPAPKAGGSAPYTPSKAAVQPEKKAGQSLQ